jgi:hypothetical protein
MAHNSIYQAFTETTHIEIPQSVHQIPRLRLDFGLKLFARKPDGMPDLTIPLDHEIKTTGFDEDGTLTIKLLTPRTGVVCVWPPPPRPYIER